MKKANIILLVSILFMACTQQNPLLNQPQTPFGVPAFDQVQLKHYLPAFKEAIRLNQEEIDAIVNNEDAPTFENTIVALDRSGIVLDRVCGVFYNVLEADGNEQMDAIANEVAPILSDFQNGILLNEGLFSRIKAVYDQRESLNLNDEQMRLLSETYKSFAQNGANLPADKKARLKEINSQLAVLSLQFGQNVVAETNSPAVQRFITDEALLEGLPESAKAAAKEEAAAGRSRRCMAVYAKAYFLYSRSAILQEPRPAQTTAHGLHNSRQSR